MAQKFKFDWNKITTKMNEQQQPQGFAEDERLYVPKKNDKGCFQGLIRFLPPKDTDIPYVKYFYHNFKIGKRYFIANCPTSLGKKCPVCEANGELWEAGKNGDKASKDLASKRKRNAVYVSNIYVIKDPATPENNGKVFLFKYGWTIFNKIMSKISPPAEAIDPTPLMIFDYYEGANFLLDINVKKSEDGAFPTYEGSQFQEKSALGNDELIEVVNNKMFDLKPFLNEAEFESYEKIAVKFDKILNGGKNSVSDTQEETRKETINEKLTEEKTSGKKEEIVTKETVEQPDLHVEESEDDFFSKLRN